jgi:hypothetical protein
MAESMESLFRRGLISQKAMKKLGSRTRRPKILDETRVQNSRMANFDSKAKDEGGVRDRGDTSVAGSRGIDTRQDLGSPQRASGRPSADGFVKDQMPVLTDEINDANNQRPAFPRGDKVKASEAKRKLGVVSKAIPSAPSQYGGPNSRKYG